ncbi:hypothetical protein C5167_044944 [Papaver somniferum]|uniref:Uncharacterized protein n=1 Tax=Papaver somniferum TaxID=3469 RepID=A0A4Y7LCC7_PAPSO|nr:hypothetical protein C5167_044944 [Papaver somniferum]
MSNGWPSKCLPLRGKSLKIRVLIIYKKDKCLKSSSVYHIFCSSRCISNQKDDVIEHPFVQWISEPQEGNWLVELTLTWRISSALLERQK